MPQDHNKLVIKMFEDAGFTAVQAKMLNRCFNASVETLQRMILDHQKPLVQRLDQIEDELDDISDND